MAVIDAVREAPTADDTRPVLKFTRHHAFIVGIDDYRHVSSLKTAVSDARQLARVLAEQQHFFVHEPLLNPSGAELRALLHTTLRDEVAADDRVLFYFAGHGIANDGDDGPTGYLVPADGDPTDVASFIPMAELQRELQALPCRHLLLIMDCCFSGAFKWSSQTRAIGTLMPKLIYKERFDRFIFDPAWQVITSAASDQKALDVLPGGRVTGDRGVVASATAASGEAHSPFAQALFDGLAGDADARTDREGDGVITATELYAYIRDRVEPDSIAAGQGKRQTPGFFPLAKHDKGEFIFLHPRDRRNLPRTPGRSPFKGLDSFNEADRLLFYGRDRVIRDLQSRSEAARLLVVSGASGTGKSSVIKAGLLPLLREAGYTILPVMRPGAHPLAALNEALKAVPAAVAGQPAAVLLIDQFEEVITRCTDDAERQAFMARLHELVENDQRLHRILVTVRSDFEPQLNTGALRPRWLAGRCTVPPFSLEELKEVVLMPTIQEVLVFEPPELVDEIVGDVVQAPGALPLLSYALSELYEAYRGSGRSDRALTKADYDRIGGVMGALRTKGDALYKSLSPAQQGTMRKLMLRMVSVEGDLASRRVPRDDLDFSAEENPRVAEVIERLVDARLVVQDTTYVEPAHDALVRAWRLLHDWIHTVGRDMLSLAARINPEAAEYAKTRNADLLWNDSPNLLVAAAAIKAVDHGFNAKEVRFIRKSVTRRRRKTIIAWAIAVLIGLALLALVGWALGERSEAQRQRAEAQEQLRLAEAARLRTVSSLFTSLKLSMLKGQPGSVCVHGLCSSAPAGDGGNWTNIGELPPQMRMYLPQEPESRTFVAARRFDRGSVLVYAQDALTKDEEITPESDNLAFAENALRWLTPAEPMSADCPAGAPTTIALWPGTFSVPTNMRRLTALVHKRGWALKLTSPNTLATDLTCAQLLWYLSDWDAPDDFATRHVPQIVAFVGRGGGLLVGGLGWSYMQQVKTGKPYGANLLGEPFGFAFTTDAFQATSEDPIRLLQSAPDPQAASAPAR